MRQSRGRSRAPGAGALVVGSALTVLSGAVEGSAGTRTSGTDRWRGREIHYELSGETGSDIRFSRGARHCRITVTVDGRERTVTLQDEEVEVDGERLDTGRYDSIALEAERDFLIVKLVATRSWSSSSSGSASGRASSDGSTALSEETSRSRSSGTSTEHHTSAFTELGDTRIRVRLEGGRSADCSITSGAGERVIRFDVDAGKNRGTIAFRPGLVSVDGADRTVDRHAQLLVTATKTSLRITADRTEVWPGD